MPIYNIDTHSIFTANTLEKFEEFANFFLSARKNSHATSTFRADKARINKLCGVFGDKLISEIRHSDLLKWLMVMEEKYKPKTTVEYLNLLKGIFRLAVNEKVISTSPAESLHVYVEFEASPDPFSRAELETMALTPTEFESDHNLIVSTPALGARMCEVIALKRGDVDIEQGVVHIHSNQVLGEAKATKNRYSDRYVEINEPLRVILTKQLELSANNACVTIEERKRRTIHTKTYEAQYLFVNPHTGLPYRDVKDFSQRVWKQFMFDASALHEQRHGESIKYRGLSQFRHTYASQALSAGANPVWLAKQLGHANTEMIFKHYGKWIKEDSQVDNNIAVSRQFSQLIEETKHPITVGSLQKQAELNRLNQVMKSLEFTSNNVVKNTIFSEIQRLEEEIARFEEVSNG
ncbi:tyrosine-type recombinase/integrase [Vibrio parahaemolyticus]|uniref:tyrosine-type recombinase/integrase n=2 Tax=Vibrio parahaemolyticus TaxID=670 RepID=UPI001A265311|nr:site-specific integrase [Vibrio parahaemolyticus]EGQ7798838.1 tyrosine-type recombinase/integrase [Vibrio parahaemolyticus]EGQ8110539.1 tyrosine-type recombinase/integrase [Vibrio parahaemolyticus]EGQ8198418.1 tyrosine-type recombinase/integrase [Vibrio parahaemolyticus]EGU0149850.1 tyrosine-type recombinase/integrase [Vibrio parahaemolyticus]EKQ5912418.1 tyrosine-type recombinase/integrase [Vibrio parahaemolyticus]